jgi:Fe2+ transport system protein FeoA
LAEIGLVKGERVSVLQVAPLGDPVILQVLDAPVIVRRADLEGVLVV